MRALQSVKKTAGIRSGARPVRYDDGAEDHMTNRNREQRPEITTITSGAALKRWYWLKDELAAEAKRRGLKYSDGKFAILDRIAHFLDTGQTSPPSDVKSKPRSKFDWHSAPLTPETVITDNYRNSQNVRRFFKAQVGDGFKFTIGFMDWIRQHHGATLADAVAEYRRMKAAGDKAPIREHNQFNQYTVDFLKDNPGAGMDEVRRVWALKRALPTDDGRHRYERSDLDL